MVSPAAKRRAVKMVMETGLHSIAAACRAINLGRSSYYRIADRSAQSRDLYRQIVEVSRSNPRYGYRRITALLRRASHTVNAK